MKREQKETLVASMRDSLQNANGSFLVNYRGLTVAQLQDLRRSLRASKGRMQVAKWRLMRIAAEGVEGISDFQGVFGDQVGLVFADEEVPPIAKAIVEFAKQNDALEVLSGFFESHALTADQIKALASLPSRDVLLGMVAGTLQAPIAGLARVLNGLLVKLVCALSEIEKQKQAQG